jgi:hypothetical protein
VEVAIVGPGAVSAKRRASMNLSVALRRAVAEQAKKYAHAESIPHCFSYGDDPAVCFFPYESDLRHGNFLDRSYKAIQANPEWRKRFTKVHTLGKRSLPVTERGRLRSCPRSQLNLFSKLLRAVPNLAFSVLLRAVPNLAFSVARLALPVLVFAWCSPIN